MVRGIGYGVDYCHSPPPGTPCLVIGPECLDRMGSPMKRQPLRFAAVLSRVWG